MSATPQTSITLRTAPEFRVSSVDQQFFSHLPFYFSFQAFTGAEQRSDNVTPSFETPGFVERSEFAPSVTWPLHVGDWLNVTPTFTFRSTYYGGQMAAGAFIDQGFSRNTEEFSLDIRLPTIERVWERGDSKWKHVIEPDFVYRYVTGVNDFSRLIRFDEDETLTDTNELEYGITQRLFHRNKSGGSDELITWRLVQKYFFDPTFGHALIPGQPNIFQTLDALTPFAFQDEPRNFSPIVSDLTITPGKRYDTEFIINYDPQRNRLDGHWNPPETEAIQGIFHYPGAFLGSQSPAASRRSAAEFRRAIQSGAHAHGVRRPEPPWLERDRWHQLRFHSRDVSGPARRSLLQRLVLRNRL